jgi:hypothetical protein
MGATKIEAKTCEWNGYEWRPVDDLSDDEAAEIRKQENERFRREDDRLAEDLGLLASYYRGRHYRTKRDSGYEQRMKSLGHTARSVARRLLESW